MTRGQAHDPRAIDADPGFGFEEIAPVLEGISDELIEILTCGDGPRAKAHRLRIYFV